MIWKNRNLKQKSGIKNYINIQNALNKVFKNMGEMCDGKKPKFQHGGIKDIFLLILKCMHFLNC